MEHLEFVLDSRDAPEAPIAVVSRGVAWFDCLSGTLSGESGVWTWTGTARRRVTAPDLASTSAGRPLSGTPGVRVWHSTRRGVWPAAGVVAGLWTWPGNDHGTLGAIRAGRSMLAERVDLLDADVIGEAHRRLSEAILSGHGHPWRTVADLLGGADSGC